MSACLYAECLTESRHDAILYADRLTGSPTNLRAASRERVHVMAKQPKVPNTISDQQMADLRRCAEKAAPPILSKEAIARRLAANKQYAKRGAN